MLIEKIQLEPDEKMLQLVRKHWFILFARTSGVVLVTLLPFPALMLLGVIHSPALELFSFSINQHKPEIAFFTGLWLLINWMTLFHIWTDYYLDVWVITSERLIAIEQNGLFNRSIGSFRLERLQDINIEINGILATIFNYGNIEAQTASGSEAEFRTEGLPDPRSIKAIIIAAAEALDLKNRREAYQAFSSDATK